MRHSIRSLLPVSLLVGCIGMAGCVPGDERADGNQPSAGEPPVADTSAAATPRADTTEAQSVVSTEAFGPVRIGMSVHELVPHLTADTDTAALAECDYVRVAGAPDSLGFMVVDGRLARIDVRGGATATAEGARVGDPERRIEELYPVLRRRPHKYAAGSFYLIAFPETVPDTLHRYVFETDGERVTQYRAGVYPPVEYVEGCS